MITGTSHVLYIGVHILTLFHSTVSINSCSSIGTDFAFGIPTNQDGKNVNIKLIIVNQNSTPADIQITTKLGTNMYNTQIKVPLIITLCKSDMMTKCDLQIDPADPSTANTIFVTANRQISLTAESANNQGFSTGTFSISPTDDTWNHYSIGSPPGTKYANQVVITNRWNKRQTVQMSNRTHNWMTMLAAGDTYSFATHSNLAGTEIQGQAGLAVVVSNACGVEAGVAEGCDFEAEMLLPDHCLGSDYVFATTAESTEGNGLEMIGLFGQAAPDVVAFGGIVTMGPGETWRSSTDDGEADWFYALQNGAAYRVLQLGRQTSTGTNLGDPSFSQVIPYSNWNRGSIRFAVGGLTPFGGWTYHNYATIIMPYCAESCVTIAKTTNCSRRVVQNGRYPGYFVALTCRLADGVGIYTVNGECADGRRPRFSTLVYGYTMAGGYAYNPVVANADQGTPDYDCGVPVPIQTTQAFASSPMPTTRGVPTTVAEPSTTLKPTTKPTMKPKTTTSRIRTTHEPNTTLKPKPIPTTGGIRTTDKPNTTLKPTTSGGGISTASPGQCNGKGSIMCTCNPGYTGPDCSHTIDFCRQLLPGIKSNTTIGEICGEHGHCLSSPSGAHCYCDPGFQGPLCSQTVTNQTTIVYRCALFPTPQTVAEKLRVGCNDGYRCLTDNLNCPFDRPRCPNPIGWCVPTAEAAVVYSTFEQSRLDSLQRASPDVCSGHGTASCICEQGYTGPRCAHQVDYCNSTCPGLVGDVGGACGAHGACESSPQGAQCSCAHGWTGHFCRTPVPGEVTISDRCILYSTPFTGAFHKVGCPASQRCLTDDLNCGFRHCDNPIGWCLPEGTVSAILEKFKAVSHH